MIILQYILFRIIDLIILLCFIIFSCSIIKNFVMTEINEFLHLEDNKENIDPNPKLEKPKRGRKKKDTETTLPKPLENPLDEIPIDDEIPALEQQHQQQQQQVVEHNIQIVDEEALFYEVNLKMQNAVLVSPDRCNITLKELQTMSYNSSNFKKLMFLYQSFNISQNYSFTSQLSGTALNLSAIPVGKVLKCEQELQETLEQDEILKEKLSELMFQNISRQELNPIYSIGMLYLKDVSIAKRKAMQKEKERDASLLKEE